MRSLNNIKDNMKLLLTFLIIIIILTAFISSVSFAYSYPLRNFIEQDKNMRILLYEDLIDFSFSPEENVQVISLGEKPLRLELDRGNYRIAINNINEYWQIQIFATEYRKKAEDIKENLHKQGYKNIIINIEDGLYKVVIPLMKKKHEVEEMKNKLIGDGWNPWLQKVKKVAEENSLYLMNSSDEIICQGINIILKGDILTSNKLFPGEIELLLTAKGIKVFNTVDLNSLLTGLLCNQFSHLNDITQDILKAQTIINRTYIINKLFSDKNIYKYIPFYRGIYGAYYKYIKAINNTEGEIFNGYDTGEYSITKIRYEKTGNSKDYREILKNLFPEKEILNLVEMQEEKCIVDADVAKGLKYTETRQLTWWGPRVITFLDLDLNNNNLNVCTHLAENKIPGLADLRDTVREEGALAGINGGYFSYTGRPLGFMIVDGLIVSEAVKHRTVMGITSEGEVLFDRLQWQGIIRGGESKSEAFVTGVNRQARDNEIVIYNKFFGKEVLCTSDTTQLIIKKGVIQEIVVGRQMKITVPQSGYIVQAQGSKQEVIKTFISEEKINYTNDFIPADWNKYEIISALGAGPLILKDGKINITAKEGDFPADIVNGRAPRSAIGMTDDNHLVFVTVDGRQPELSIGMTLNELAKFMQNYGISRAMNLDGGGSSRMVVRGYTMNNPSQKRLIASEIILKIKGNGY